MSLFSRYLKELIEFGRFKLIMNTILIVLLGLSEGIALVILLPLLSIVGLSDSQSNSFFTSLTRFMSFDSWTVQNRLFVVIGIYLTINSIQTILSRYQSITKLKIQNEFNSQLTIRMFRKISFATWSFITYHAKSDITHLMNNELSRVGVATQQALNLFTTLILSFIQILIAFLISPIITTFVLFSGLLFVLISYPFIRESKKMGQEISTHARSHLTELMEHYQNLKEVKVYGLERPQIQEFSNIRYKMDQATIEFQKLNSRVDLLFKIGSSILISIFLYVSLISLRLSTQEFIIVTVIFSRLWPRFSSFQLNIQNLAMMLPAFEQVKKIENLLDQKTDNITRTNLEVIHSFNHLLELKDIGFSYDTTPVLKKISMIINKGTTVAIVGKSGSGKSTLIDIILGLYSPSEGEILIDHLPLKDHLLSLRGHIGYVSQTASLLNTSIRNNILWVKPDAKDEEIFEALKKASAYDFVKALKHGLDTVIGDQGIRLSGGERQRIVLARALIREPKILILDEATSSLDQDNELLIKQALDELKGEITMIIVAHRFSTIKSADCIFVLDQGTIVESGTYSELLSRDSLFAKLNQMSRLETES